MCQEELHQELHYATSAKKSCASYLNKNYVFWILKPNVMSTLDFNIQFNVRIKKSGKNKNCPRTIVCKLLSLNGKVLVLKKSNKLEVTNIDINEDFSHDKMIHKKQFWQQTKSLRYEGKLAYLNCRSIVVK